MPCLRAKLEFVDRLAHMTFVLRAIAACLVSLIMSVPSLAQQTSPGFHWPDGKHFALSLSFDDARVSQVDTVLPVLDKYAVKATFFLVPSLAEKRLDGWKRAVAAGHEIGNHSLHHPCSLNYRFAADNALENYSLEMMRDDLVKTNQWIKDKLDVTASLFAYPCGQTFVGHGQSTKSYVPLVAEMFTVGRGFFLMDAPLITPLIDPVHSDLAQIAGIAMDDRTFDQVLALLQQAAADKSWVVLVGHDVGPSGTQTTRPLMLEKLIEYAQDPKNGIWLAPVGVVTKYVQAHRGDK
jgi:peptidoglycan/xylan/chitin deacetylase (PgdA/CDA1 family)